MTIGDIVRVIGKVKKQFELITKAKNKLASLQGSTVIDIFCTIMNESYYKGREIEILSLTKSFSLSSPPKKQRMTSSTTALIYRSERLRVGFTKDNDIGYILELGINTTIVTSNLSRCESQSTNTKALKRLFREETSPTSRSDTNLFKRTA